MGKKILAIADLLARREQAQKSKPEHFRVYVKLLEGELSLEKIPISRVLHITNGLDATNVEDAFQAKIDLIYACCPIFRDRALQEAYSCVEPSDIVCKVLDDNLGAINTIALAIMDMYGMTDDDDTHETVKN